MDMHSPIAGVGVLRSDWAALAACAAAASGAHHPMLPAADGAHRDMHSPIDGADRAGTAPSESTSLLWPA